ncbi:MAG: hypothetical protein R2735_16045 [Microthrixaceae bacterium]
MATRIEYHPEFSQQFKNLEATNYDAFADVAALVIALEAHGHLIEGLDHTADPSHPVVTSKYDMWALRRTPSTSFTPDATTAPVLRIPYVWMIDKPAKQEYALICFIGDKTQAGNKWYPAAVQAVEGTLLPLWGRANPGHEPRTKRRR